MNQTMQALRRLHDWALAQEGDCMFSGDHPIAQAAAALQRSEWLPIETAPEDEHILIALDDEWTALDTHFASEVAGIRALPKPVTWTELHKFADAVAKRASSAIRAENARLRAILDASREQEP